MTAASMPRHEGRSGSNKPVRHHWGHGIDESAGPPAITVA